MREQNAPHVGTNGAGSGGSVSDQNVGRAMLPTMAPADTLATVPTVDHIATARDVQEIYRRGSAALSACLGAASCFIFDRDEYGQFDLAYRLDDPARPAPKTDPLTTAEQIQGWWLTLVQASGPPTTARPLPYPKQPGAFVIPLVADTALHGTIFLRDCVRARNPLAAREAISLATTMALTLHLAAQRSQLQKAVLPEQVEEAITQERRRIAREIHDGVAQSLAYLNLKTELLDRLVTRDPAAAREQAAMIRQILQSAMAELRRCIGDLRRPASGQGAAITAQLRTLASSLSEMPNLQLAVQEVSGARLAPDVERTVLGIVREALQNIRKHADAKTVQVEVTREGEALRVLVVDDGQGFQPEQQRADPGQHFGLLQMRELAQELGGDLEIASQPGAGTRVEALIPVSAPPAGKQLQGTRSD
jgi:signal transduction histidine kinase